MEFNWGVRPILDPLLKPGPRSKFSPQHPVPEPAPSDKQPDSPQPSLGAGPDCRARRIGNIKLFADCLVSKERHCGHGLYFGESCFCHHPQRELIIARTEAGEKSEGA